MGQTTKIVRVYFVGWVEFTRPDIIKISWVFLRQTPLATTLGTPKGTVAPQPTLNALF